MESSCLCLSKFEQFRLVQLLVVVADASQSSSVRYLSVATASLAHKAKGWWRGSPEMKQSQKYSKTFGMAAPRTDFCNHAQTKLGLNVYNVI